VSPPPAGPAGAAKNIAKLVATLILCSPRAANLPPFRAQARPAFCRTPEREICLRERSWLSVPSSPGYGRRARLLHDGKRIPLPCTHPSLKTLLPSASCSTQLSFGAPVSGSIPFNPCQFCPGPKRVPREIRYARPVVCQGTPGAKPVLLLRSAPYEALRSWLLLPYRLRFLLDIERSPPLGDPEKESSLCGGKLEEITL
jgi:hypothetical protein